VAVVVLFKDQIVTVKTVLLVDQAVAQVQVILVVEHLNKVTQVDLHKAVAVAERVLQVQPVNIQVVMAHRVERVHQVILQVLLKL
jgi:hypothetical protein